MKQSRRSRGRVRALALRVFDADVGQLIAESTFADLRGLELLVDDADGDCDAVFAAIERDLSRAQGMRTGSIRSWRWFALAVDRELAARSAATT